MCFRKKNIFDEITKDEIIDAICQLEREEGLIEEKISLHSNKINVLMEDGKKAEDRISKLFIVKKISNENELRDRSIKQGLYVLYNIKMANRLKDAFENNDLIKRVSGLKLLSCLHDQKELAIFLNKALDTKVLEEDVLTNADDMFVSISEMYNENLKIYGITSMQEDELLSLFEIKEEDDKQNKIVTEEKWWTSLDVQYVVESYL